MFGSIFGRNDSKEPRQRKDWIPGGQPRPTRPPSAKEPWKPPREHREHPAEAEAYPDLEKESNHN